MTTNKIAERILKTIRENCTLDTELLTDSEVLSLIIKELKYE